MDIIGPQALALADAVSAPQTPPGGAYDTRTLSHSRMPQAVDSPGVANLVTGNITTAAPWVPDGNASKLARARDMYGPQAQAELADLVLLNRAFQIVEDEAVSTHHGVALSPHAIVALAYERAGMETILVEEKLSSQTDTTFKEWQDAIKKISEGL